MKSTFAFALLLCACLHTGAQKIEKPTLISKPCNEPQVQLVREGVSLHDSKKYSDAVAKYEQVIADNPDCTLALYELSMTYYAMGEKTKAMETAYRGSKYKSDELALFYLTMANVIDDVGKPEEAIKIYRDAIKMLEGEKDSARSLSSVHYNLGVTLTKQKKYPEARIELKKAVAHNELYPSPHFLLSVIYHGSKYKVPALLAAGRFLSLELTSPRSQTAARILTDILKPASKNEKTGNIEIFLDLNAPKDEGDFAGIELLLGTLTSIKNDEDKNKSEEEVFVDAVETVIALVSENKDAKSKFVGKTYVPFFAEMKKQGHTPVLGYLVLHHMGNQTATKWLTTNDAKLKGFIAWSKGFTQAK